MPASDAKCGVCGTGEPFMICPDTGTILCMNCMFWPGQLGGIDHKLPNGNYCAHRPKNAVGGPATRIYTPAQEAGNGR